MDGLLEAVVIAGMFLLRLGLPLAITLLVGYLLRRLDAKWQAEARAQLGMPQAQKAVAPAQPLPRPAGQPCWVEKGCDEARRARCPAPKRPNVPCWLARRQAEGRLPAECYNCGRFALRQAAAGAA
jgi:hypothetical protein